MADEQQPITPLASRARATRTLEHIHIHEDAILIAPNDYAAATGLETALNELTLGRRPLEEINLHRVQFEADTAGHSRKDESKEAVDARAADATTLSTIDSSQSRSNNNHHHHHNHKPSLLPSPSRTANRKIRFADSASRTTAKNAASATTVTSAQEQTSTAGKPSTQPSDQHMVLGTDRSPSAEASSYAPVIQISKRQQGQGDMSSTLPSQSAANVDDSAKCDTELPSSMTTPVIKRSCSNKENVKPAGMMTPLRLSSAYDVLEAAVVEAATPPAAVSRPQSAGNTSNGEAQPQEPVEETANGSQAVQELIETAPTSQPGENVSEVISAAQPADDEATAVPVSPTASSTSDMSLKQVDSAVEAPLKTPPRIKKAPVVRTTKAAQARISLAHGPKDAARPPAWGPPRESLGHARTSSLRQSSGPRVVSNGSTVSNTSNTTEKKEIVIPHSKPRPMSMSFPTPPPPPKSTKAPTRPTFQLPGEAVAAKLKAAREEREKKEDNAKIFKARPVPAAIKNAPAVRQTTTSRARESLGGVKELLQRPSLGLAHQRASSVVGLRSADKRQSIMGPAPQIKIEPTVDVKELLPKSRSSTSLANISKPRSATPDVVRAGHVKTAKGREVFSRNAFANDNAEREKRAKEEATRKARADAAERSRQLSREWAEKQKAKSALKMEVSV